MKKILITIYLLANIIIIAQVDTTFFGLRGYEDLDGNTQLFFRMLSHFQVERTEGNYKGITRRDIFHLDVKNNTDSLFLLDFIDFHQPLPQIGKIVTDFEFTDSTLTDLYQCGDGVFTSYEPDPIVVFNRDYDNYFEVNSFSGFTSNLEIAKVDSNIEVYVSLVGDPSGIFTKSSNRSFDLIETTENFHLVSVNRNQPNIIFVEKENGFLFKSSDAGITFSLADSTIFMNNENTLYNSDYINPFFIYDSDSFHIYRVIENQNRFQLVVSDSSGELGSWDQIFESDKNIFITYDPSQSGIVYFANDKHVFKSENYGKTYTTFIELDKSISGIYKKPNSDLLYATTAHKLLEISPHSINVLKQLIDYEALSYYPLHIGDKWYYSVRRIDYDPDFYQNETNYHLIREIVKDTTLNNKRYFEIKETSDIYDSIDYTYIRIDSLSGVVYQYEESIAESNEFIKENLSLEINQYFQTWINFDDYNYEMEVYLSKISNQSIFEFDTLNKLSKTYEFNGPYFSEYFLSKDIGKSYQFSTILDGFDEYYSLEATYINSKKYGDTTLVSVVKKNLDLLSEFSLSQNYPNPFNPSTTIKYSIPTVGNKHAYSLRQEFVTLKVYDILGREVATLVDKEQKAGSYEVQFDASHLTSGIYFYRLQSGTFSENKKMIFLK